MSVYDPSMEISGSRGRKKAKPRPDAADSISDTKDQAKADPAPAPPEGGSDVIPIIAPLYSEGGGQIFHGKARLTNFMALIETEIIHHDVETRSRYVISGVHQDGTNRRVTIDADEFESLRWIIPKLGPEFRIEAGIKDTRNHVRAAIQFLSEGKILTEHVHTALGWVEHGGRPIYLHAGGGIDRDGATDAVRVEASDSLAGYVLPEPPTGERLKECVQAVLGIDGLHDPDRPGSRSIAAVMMTLPWRAVLDPFEASVHLSGCSGSCKTSLATLMTSHFGQALCSDPLQPGLPTVGWDATINALQRYAYDCRHSLMLVDDLNGEKEILKATEFFQGIGNRKGKERMNKDLTLAQSLDPRTTVISTGETDVRRRSALGRMITLRIDRSMVNTYVLAHLQDKAKRGLFAGAMAAYIRYLATGHNRHYALECLKARAMRLAGEFRKAAPGAHPRHSASCASMLAAYEQFLLFARDMKITENPLDLEGFMDKARAGLLDLLADQADVQAQSSPARRFINLLRTAFTSNRYHLENADSSTFPCPPDQYAAMFGWHKEHVYQGGDAGNILDWTCPANSKRVGYFSQEKRMIYLEPGMCKALATDMGRQSSEPFENIAEIGRELASEGMIRTFADRKRRQFQGAVRIHGGTPTKMIHLRLEAFIGPVTPDETPVTDDSEGDVTP